MFETGRPGPLGASYDGDGVNFALFSSAADAVELCLFDAHGDERRGLFLGKHADGVWSGYLPGCRSGQHYGYRVHGPYDLEKGLRCNPHKLLIDPYARELGGRFQWSPALYDFRANGDVRHNNEQDSAPFVPRCVVTCPEFQPATRGPATSWAHTVIYELSLRGFTMRHPDVPDVARGRYRGMTNAKVLDYIKSLGITAVEIMPVQAFIDEAFLVDKGLKNFWGYNTLSFFVPAGRYANADPRSEFRDMINAIHDAGLEVFMDIAYNHTAEGDELGPTLSFRGIDNLAYYRVGADNPGQYVNDTGCGNTVNVDNPQVRRLVLDNLRYWHTVMGVDGFRFDLAPVLGRNPRGFDPQHPLLQAIEQDTKLAACKFIAEPWDLAADGYQLGRFPKSWAEWNDKYRDSLRRFWRGVKNESEEIGRRLRGSPDVFAARGKPPWSSVNLVTAHDGFTLNDLVSYEHRHNEANGEDNEDGHRYNLSCNYGVEGPTDDVEIVGLRRKHRLNLLATLLLSQGTPMLLAGDEFGNSQQGNNNAYSQDNAVGWLDWSGLQFDVEFTAAVRQLLQLRQVLSQYPHVTTHDSEQRLCAYFATSERGSVPGFALLLNPGALPYEFILPGGSEAVDWLVRFASDRAVGAQAARQRLTVPGRSLVLLEHALP